MFIIQLNVHETFTTIFQLLLTVHCPLLYNVNTVNGTQYTVLFIEFIMKEKSKMADLKQLEEMLGNLQSEINKLKEEKKIEQSEPVDYEKDPAFQELIDVMKDSQFKLLNLMKEMIADKKMFLATCIYATTYDGQGSGIGTSYFSSLDCIDEDGLSAALEPFTNPRRIAILKQLFDGALPANEISKRTGLVGGQLYHHLSNLEGAGLIEKKGDKYNANRGTQGIIDGLIAAIGGTKIAKNEYIEK